MSPLVRRTWSPRGQTPVLRQRGRARRKVSVIPALTISSKRRAVRTYFGFLPNANYDDVATLAFLKELSRAVRGPIELIWDRLRTHHGGHGRGVARAKQPRARPSVASLRPRTQSCRTDLGACQDQPDGQFRSRRDSGTPRAHATSRLRYRRQSASAAFLHPALFSSLCVSDMARRLSSACDNAIGWPTAIIPPASCISTTQSRTVVDAGVVWRPVVIV